MKSRSKGQALLESHIEKRSNPNYLPCQRVLSRRASKNSLFGQMLKYKSTFNVKF